MHQTLPRSSEPARRRAAPDPGDCRCHCGSLLARRVSGGVEIKCRGCKRLMIVPLASDDAEWRDAEVDR
jgi:hypothetical protein